MKIDLRSNKLFTLGLVCLILTNTTRFILTRQLQMTEDSTDLIFGCLMGLAIGALILSVISKRRCAESDAE